MVSADMATAGQLNTFADPDYIPGTVHLVDLNGNVDGAHASSSGKRDIILVPSPTADPDDPLNWSYRRKLLATACMCVFTLMTGIAGSAIASVLVPISEQTGLTINTLNQGTGYLFLLSGWSCLIWQPLAIQYGKRPIYLFSILGTMCMMIWAPYTKTNGQWIGSKIMQGFFAAPVETLCQVSMTDIWYTHERGFFIGVYALFLAGSNFLAPIFSGKIAESMGWRWVLYWCAIFCAIGFVFIFFLMEETNYGNRHGTRTSNSSTSSPLSKSASVTKTDEKSAPDSSSLEDASPQPYHHKTYFQKLALYQPAGLHKPNRLLSMSFRPLYLLLTFPVLLYAGFLYGSSLIIFNILNATASPILSAAPYNFSSTSVGLAYFAPLVGVMIAATYTGPFGDTFIRKLARSRARKTGTGILEAEDRLWLFSASLVLLPLGLVLWGVGAAAGVHWFGLIFAMTIIACTHAIGLALAVGYAIDSYRDLAAEATVAVILVRNSMGFAVGYGIGPWIDGMGLRGTFGLAAGLGVFYVLTVGVFLWCGKGLRGKSRGRYVREVEGVRRDGLVR